MKKGKYVRGMKEISLILLLVRLDSLGMASPPSRLYNSPEHSERGLGINNLHRGCNEK